MNTWIIETNLEELELVCALLAPAPPDEIAGAGVWVRTTEDCRYWSVRNEHVTWEVVGDPVDRSQETRCLPARAVWEARILAMTSLAHEVVITIPDDLVCLVQCDSGSSVVDLPRESEPPSLPAHVNDAAVATVTAGALNDLLLRARCVPIGESNEQFPDAELIVADGEVAIFVDWTIRSGLRTSCRIPAETIGQAQRTLLMGHLWDLVHGLSRETELTLRVPDRPELPLLIETGLFRLAVRCLSVGASLYHDELAGVLGEVRGAKVRSVELGKFFVSTRTRIYQVDLVDRPRETISVCTEVCRDVPNSLEVLMQVNETNAAMVGSRLWISDGAVWAGFDLPVAAMESVERSITELERQVNGLDVYLSALSEAT